MGGQTTTTETRKREKRASDLPELLDAAHSTPVKLNAGANPVDARAKDQDVRCPKVEVMGGAPVRQVQVICLGWPLSCNGIDLFHRWADSQFLTQLPNSQLGAKPRERPLWEQSRDRLRSKRWGRVSKGTSFGQMMIRISKVPLQWPS